jgi:hypothetical protein
VGFLFLDVIRRQLESSRSKEQKKLERQEKHSEDLDELLLSLNGRTTEDLEKTLSSKESQILRELVQGIRALRYGSILLVVHDGRLVEVTKTVRLRTSRAGQKE